MEEDRADDLLAGAGLHGRFVIDRDVALAAEDSFLGDVDALASGQRAKTHRHLLGVRPVQERGDFLERVAGGEAARGDVAPWQSQRRGF